MVEHTGETGRRAKPRHDWIAIYDGWRRGDDPVALAKRHGVKPSTIALRCGWIDAQFPPGAPARLIAEFSRRLEEAQSALESGALADAERRAKALTAMIRAARALEDWSEDLNTRPKTRRGAVASDSQDYKAQLERRLDQLASVMAEKRLPEADQPGAGEDLSAQLAPLGSPRADPAKRR